MGKVEQYLLDKIREQRTVHLTLIDPEKTNPLEATKIAKNAEEAGTIAIMVGGSTAVSAIKLDEIIKSLKTCVKLPVILFPNNITGISPHADAIWFMSLLNSTNSYFITGSQALGAPLVKQYGLEAISMGYLIVGDGGGAAAFIGQAHPIPYNKPEVAAIYALAAQYLGMHFVYLEAGSGVKKTVPPKTIALTKKNIDIPLIVGGGIRKSDEAKKAAESGADLIVTGTLVEKDSTSIGERISEIVRAIKRSTKPS